MGERAYDLMVVKGAVSPSVSFADSSLTEGATDNGILNKNKSPTDWAQTQPAGDFCLPYYNRGAFTGGYGVAGTARAGRLCRMAGIVLPAKRAPTGCGADIIL